MELVIQKNDFLIKSIESINKNVRDLNQIKETTQPENTSEILNLLLKSSKQNCNSDKKQGFRYDDVLKLFSVYLYMLCGRYAYETLQKNISLPSLSSVSNYLKTHGPQIREADLRADQLKTYLARFEINHVWLSEDATRITSRVQYDSSSNEIVGFVLPFDKNGMPIKSTYMARSAQEIKEHFDNNHPISSQVIYYSF